MEVQPPSVTPRPAHRLAVLAGLPSAASAATATCGTACAGACAPPVLGLLGVSGSSAVLVSWMAWLRPIFIVISLASLAVAFHRAYRHPPRNSARFVESRKFVWLMAIVSIGLLALPYSRGSATATSAPCAQPCPPRNSSAAAPQPCPL
jgi:hypothetical protein